MVQTQFRVVLVLYQEGTKTMEKKQGVRKLKVKCLCNEKESTDNCYLIYGDDGHLTCSYNHKSGEECLMNIKNNDESIQEKISTKA